MERRRGDTNVCCVSSYLILTVTFKEGGIKPVLLRRRLRFSKAIYPRSLTEQVTGRTSFEASLVILKFKFLPRCQTTRSYLPAYWSELSRSTSQFYSALAQLPTLITLLGRRFSILIFRDVPWLLWVMQLHSLRAWKLHAQPERIPQHTRGHCGL